VCGGGPPEAPIAISDRSPEYLGYRLLAAPDVKINGEAKQSFAGAARRART
jgi:hypothetical protein